MRYRIRVDFTGIQDRIEDDFDLFGFDHRSPITVTVQEELNGQAFMILETDDEVDAIMVLCSIGGSVLEQ